MSILNKFVLRKFCAFLGLFAVVLSSGSFVDLPTADAAGETGLDSAYVDTASPGPVYALFAVDLGAYAEMIPQLVGNFDLLNSADASCGVASSASLMASFHDISNQFVELEFSTVSCPEATEPARLKFTDPENSAIFDTVNIQDVSEITPPTGGGGGGWGTDGTDDHEVIVNVTFDDWVEFPIMIVAWYGTAAEGDPDGAVSIEAPGAAHIYVPHAAGETSVMIAAVWWEGGNQNGDPSYFGFSESPISISGDGPTTVGVTMVTGGGGNDPVVSYSGTSNITQTSANLTGSLDSSGDKLITRRGIRVGTDTGYGTVTLSGDSLSGFGTGVYSFDTSSLTTLVCGTTYHVQAFVMDSDNVEYYSSDATFATSACGGVGFTYYVDVRSGSQENWNGVRNADVLVGPYNCNTGDSGSCSISGITSGTYTITVNAGFYETYSAENVVVEQSNANYAAYLTPNSVSALSGIITDSSSDPLDGVTIFSVLFDGDGAPPPPTTTSSGGQFSFSDLQEGGGHVVFAVKDGYVGKYLGPSDLLASNDNTHFDMQLDTATASNSGSISGTLSAGGTPLSGKKVLVFTADFSGQSWPEVLSVGIGESDASGNFTVNGLAPSDSYAVMLLHDFVDYETFGVSMATVTAGITTDFNFNILLPEVTTSAASDILQTSAYLNGSIGNTYELNGVASGGTDSLSDAGFEYGTVAGGTFTNQSEWINMDDQTGNITTQLWGLECGTEYQFRSYASSLAGTSYGSTATFITSSCTGGGTPVVTTASATNVTSGLATVNASVVTNGANIVARGFEYGETLSYGSDTMEAYGSGEDFYWNLSSGLTCNTTYHYRAYVSDGTTRTYGADMTFMTSACEGNAVDAAIAAGNLACEFVDENWQSIFSLNISMSASAYDPIFTTISGGDMATWDSFILVANPTSNPIWTLSIAPTDGVGALWSDGAGHYADFNDSSGVDGEDSDTFVGRLTINSNGLNIYPYQGVYSNAGLSPGGSNNYFVDGVVDSVTIVTAGETAVAPGYWGFGGISVAQEFPGGLPVGTYYLDLTISVI